MNYDVITTDVITPGSIICVDHMGALQGRLHYKTDDYVKRSYNSDKNCPKRNILKVVTSQLWRHSHLTSPLHCPWQLSFRVPKVPTPISHNFLDIWPKRSEHTHRDTQAGRRLVRSLLTLCDTMQAHVCDMTSHDMTRHFKSCHVTSYVMWLHVMWRHVIILTSRLVTSCHDVMWRHDMSWLVMC